MISVFHETKTSTVDMKVRMYSKIFFKKKLEKKVKSPISMKIGTFNTSKCKGKLQKTFREINFFLYFWPCRGVDLWPVGDR